MTGRAKRRVCRDDGAIYESVKDAALDNDVSANAIYAAAAGSRKSAAGHEWCYVDEDGLPYGTSCTVELRFESPEPAAYLSALLAYEAGVRMTTPATACMQLVSDAAKTGDYPEDAKETFAELESKVRARALARAVYAAGR